MMVRVIHILQRKPIFPWTHFIDERYGAVPGNERNCMHCDVVLDMVQSNFQGT